MSQPSVWGVPRSGDSIPMTTYATQDDESLDALLSMHKGSAAPGYAVEGTDWLDDSDDPIWVRRVYDGAAWIALHVIDTVNNIARSTDTVTGAAGGTANAATLTSPLGLTAYVDGMKFRMKWPATNDSSTVTVNVDAVGTKQLKLWNGDNPWVGDLQGTAWVEFVYHAAGDVMKIVGGAGFIPAAASLATQSENNVNIDGGVIDNTVIGGDTPAAGTFSALASSSVNIDGGAIDGTVIGGSTPAAAAFSTLATSGLASLGNGATVAGANLSVVGGNALNINDPTLNNGLLNVRQNSPGDPVQVLHASHGSYSDQIARWHSARSGSSDWDFLRAYSNGSSDLEIILRGNGQINADGSISGGGADYAEMFENLRLGVVPAGTTLVLDGRRVRPARKGEEDRIIGAVSAAATTIGNNPLKWPGRRDHFGRPATNLAYDPSRPYAQRSTRPREWSVVGVLGRLAIPDGQPVNPFWMRLGELAPGLTEYFVFPAIALSDAVRRLIQDLVPPQERNAA